jgi:ubiquinone/menaquinone biosynthesis C-methylase UbiE
MTSLGREGLSEQLRKFVAEQPWERATIVSFLQVAANSLPPGAEVLDVGAGDAPYRELFAHTDYRTHDWTASVHEGAIEADYVGSANALPIADETFDAVVCTQVLEHVPDPLAVLNEIRRVLRPGGRVYLTAPLAWELHELPHDYYRYTAEGLKYLFDRAAFVDVRVEPRNGCFTTFAQLLWNAGSFMGRAPDGLNDDREEVATDLQQLAEKLALLEALDTQHVFPLGYQVSACR